MARTAGRGRVLEVPRWIERFLVKRDSTAEEDRLLLEMQWTGGPNAEDPLCRRYGHTWGHPDREKGMDRRCKRCGRWQSGRQ